MDTLCKKQCGDILTYYGKRPQIVIAVEELSELQKALCKAYRAVDKYAEAEAKKMATEEIGDCKIMIQQMMSALGIKERDVNIVINKKLTRQIRRIQEEKV